MLCFLEIAFISGLAFFCKKKRSQKMTSREITKEIGLTSWILSLALL